MLHTLIFPSAIALQLENATMIVVAAAAATTTTRKQKNISLFSIALPRRAKFFTTRNFFSYENLQ